MAQVGKKLALIFAFVQISFCVLPINAICDSSSEQEGIIDTRLLGIVGEDNSGFSGTLDSQTYDNSRIPMQLLQKLGTRSRLSGPPSLSRFLNQGTFPIQKRPQKGLCKNILKLLINILDM